MSNQVASDLIQLNVRAPLNFTGAQCWQLWRGLTDLSPELTVMSDVGGIFCGHLNFLRYEFQVKYDCGIGFLTQLHEFGLKSTRVYAPNKLVWPLFEFEYFLN